MTVPKANTRLNNPDQKSKLPTLVIVLGSDIENGNVPRTAADGGRSVVRGTRIEVIMHYSLLNLVIITDFEGNQNIAKAC
jgi:hypothetical protein